VLEEGIYRFSVLTSSGEEFLLLRPLPTKESTWGVLSPLEGTEIGGLITIVSGEDMSQALHGRVMPLVRTLGRSPRGLLKKIEGDMTCALIKTCLLADRAACYPCSKLPHCYAPPDVSEQAGLAAATVLRAWADGRYVVIVEGPEFSL
jgi:hypothetical protein